MKNTELSLSLINDLDAMSDDDIFRICHGYTQEEEKNYTEELFEKDISALKLLINQNNGEYDTDDNIINLPAVFWGRLKEKVSYSYKLRKGFFPTYFEEFENYGIKLEIVSGQGTLTKFSFLDIKSKEYIKNKILRDKRNKIIEIEKQKNKILRKLPKIGFFVKFWFLNKDKKANCLDIGVVSDIKVVSMEYKTIEITIDSLRYGVVKINGDKDKLKAINGLKILKNIY
jgi:hypothetical protein